jgi:hypothetical protein
VIHDPQAKSYVMNSLLIIIPARDLRQEITIAILERSNEALATRTTKDNKIHRGRKGRRGHKGHKGRSSSAQILDQLDFPEAMEAT